MFKTLKRLFWDKKEPKIVQKDTRTIDEFRKAAGITIKKIASLRNLTLSTTYGEFLGPLETWGPLYSTDLIYCAMLAVLAERIEKLEQQNRLMLHSKFGKFVLE